LGNGINESNELNNNYRFGYDGLEGDKWFLKFYADYMENVTDFFGRLYTPEIASQYFWTDGSTVDAIGGNYLYWKYKQVGSTGQYQLSNNHTLSFGIEFRDEWVADNPFQGNWNAEINESSGGTEYIPCNCRNRGIWLSGEKYDLMPESDRFVYNLDQWSFNNNVNLTLGIRNDHYDDFGSNTSIRGSLIYNQSKNTQFKFIYGEAFRAPSFLETRTSPASNLVGNPDLKPETIQTIDLVWQQKISQSNLILTYSNSTIDNKIRELASDIVVVEGVIDYQPQNVGSSNLSNWELEINHSISESVLLRAGLTHHVEYVKQSTAQ